MSNDTKYNGWTNYETWLVNLWMDNEQGTQEYWQERAQEAVKDALDSAESDPKASATYELSKEIEQQHEEYIEETVKPSGFIADLLNASMSAVNWYEIAEHLTSEITIYSAGWSMPGYMPDSDPVMFTDAEDAMSYIQETAIESLADDPAVDEDSEAVDDMQTAIEAWGADSNGEFGDTIGKYHYFVSIV